MSMQDVSWDKLEAAVKKSIDRIIELNRVMSDCCGSAVIKNKDGDDICAECLEACDKVELGGK